jgi:hypothetical protein
MKARILILIYVLALIIPFNSCRRNNYKVDISGIKYKAEIKRLDRDLFLPGPGSLPDSIPNLIMKYGSFLRYFSYVINIGELSDSAWPGRLISFCTDRQNNEIFAASESIFSDIHSIEKELETAFRYYLWYFHGRRPPMISTCITGFNNSIITGDSVLGIGLDRYLGAENRFYSELGIYRYQAARMHKGYIVRDCIYGWAASEFDLSVAGYEADNALTSIIHEGKLLYYTQCMIPDATYEIIFGFSEDQMKFCRNNEGRMWQYLVENKLLFSTDQLSIRKLTGEAPFSSYFSTESPGRAATWLGFRIVEAYMSKNHDVTLAELMKEKDVQKILEKAAYRPRIK